MVGTVTGGPRVLLRLEGVGVFTAASVIYDHQGESWLLYAAVFLAPDLFMLGYLGGSKIGSILYNFGHCYVPPLACIAWGAFVQAPSVLGVGLIWAAHIGFDRALGYGLKYGEGFGISHLGIMGKLNSPVATRSL